MSETLPVPDRGDAELRAAVKRLMAFRAEVLRPLWLSYADCKYHAHDAQKVLRLMNDPIWHCVEEALK